MNFRTKCITFKPWKLWLLIFLIIGRGFWAQAIDIRSSDPYYSAVVIDAKSERILWEDHASAEAYPASMIKLMNVFVVLDDLSCGKLRLDQPVQIDRETEQIGGRQVWLKVGEVFPLEELIYATMVHSANDAATAIAIHASGSKQAHAQRMNAKAKEIGLRSTRFHNVHGLPPSPGQHADVSCALDMARLGVALIKEHPEVLTYSSTYMRDFRPGNPVKLTSSNKLLRNVEGCDGLKTGYFYAGGFSVTATAERNGTRIIAVVMGCKKAATRNQWAERLLERGFALAEEQ
ncbi:MAG: D-alanyl-D-alanine carboxypeptidase [Kiritimatiellaceae bacterium]|nr:D-alanyl-D-alanine carboxypeptidase [Kiritimatiellaceae bacterium]